MLVTHDTILATLASRLLTTPLSMAEWPDFLGNLDISLARGGELQLIYTSSRHLSRYDILNLADFGL